MSGISDASHSFLLALSGLFSIVNPIAAALIFSQVTADRTHAQRLVLARKIGIYSAIVMLAALWGGAAVLNFFGVTLAALRIAGGLVVGASAWELLSQAEENDARKQQQASHAVDSSDGAFFPLTMPLTTGPGTISVAIALGSNLPPETTQTIPFYTGASLAALAVATMIWVAYRWADSLVNWLGRGRALVLGRLAAFLLLCVGTQITLGGVIEVLKNVIHS